MLEPSWIADHVDDFDIFHVQFGFDALDTTQLQQIVAALRAAGKPLIYTVHDLRNPHHSEPELHESQLDVLIPQADRLITLTPGAARTIRDRWGRDAVVLPHPHVVPLSRIRPPDRSADRPFVVGVHAKSVRASMAPVPVIAAIAELLEELPRLRLRVDVHRDVYEADGARHDPALRALVDECAAREGFQLAVHDYFSDDELWSYLQALDISVLPYRFGTHSGWLEACYDLGTTVLAPDCGYYSEQRPCLTYRHDEVRLDADSLREAVRWAYRHRPTWQAERDSRIVERDGIARAHQEIYAQVLR